MGNPLISRKELAQRWQVPPHIIDKMANDGIIVRREYGKFKVIEIEEYEQGDHKETETFMERRLKQQLIAKDAEIAKLKQKIYQAASFLGSTMAELAEGHK